MKTITIYDLLGMVKDGKAPKKIKIDEDILNLEKGIETLYKFEKGGGSLAFGYYIDNNKLDDEVEILEEEPTISKLYINNELQYDLKEEKKIPKKLLLIVNTEVNYPDDKFVERILTLFYEFNNENRLKINEIIDYLKSKGDE